MRLPFLLKVGRNQKSGELHKEHKVRKEAKTEVQKVKLRIWLSGRTLDWIPWFRSLYHIPEKISPHSSLKHDQGGGDRLTKVAGFG